MFVQDGAAGQYLQDKVIILTHLFSIYGSFAGLSSPVVLSKESDQVTEGIIPFT